MARPSCIHHAKNKLKLNGYLIIDNAERSYYLTSANFGKKQWKFRRFEGPVPYIYHFSKTLIVQKIQ